METKVESNKNVFGDLVRENQLKHHNLFHEIMKGELDGLFAFVIGDQLDDNKENEIHNVSKEFLESKRDFESREDILEFIDDSIVKHRMKRIFNELASRLIVNFN